MARHLPLGRACGALALAVALGAPAVARAGEPILPLSQVQPGMRCTAYSVVQGTTISSFDADVIDVISGDAGARQPYILVRTSGPAVDRTGIGPGFSGSPIYCPGPDGTPTVAGAISEGIGEYGNQTVLATPIESVLGEPVDPPVSRPVTRARARRDARLLRAARPLATPLTISGLSPPVARALSTAAGRAGRVVYAVPGPPRDAAFPPQTLQPGSSVGVGLASGDFTAGSIGTVTYVDGPDVWAYGHPEDAAGRRSLLLQDAYVYDVVANPIGSADLSSYKYAALGHTLGTLTDDGISGVVGRLGAPPPQFPMKITAIDQDTGRVLGAQLSIADETGVGLPTGASSLTTVGSAAVAQMAYEALDGSPVRQSGTMCVRIALAETPHRLRFCNSYVGGQPVGSDDASGGPLVDDFAAAAQDVDAYNFGPLHIIGVAVDIRLRRDLRLAYLLSASAPSRVRRGTTATVVLHLRRVDGPRFDRRVRVRVPAGTPTGPRELAFAGTAADLSTTSADAMTTVLDLGDLLGDDDSADTAGPRSIRGLIDEVAAIHRPDGVAAAVVRSGASADAAASAGSQVYRDPQLRIAGATRVPVVVARARRRR